MGWGFHKNQSAAMISGIETPEKVNSTDDRWISLTQTPHASQPLSLGEI